MLGNSRSSVIGIDPAELPISVHNPGSPLLSPAMDSLNSLAYHQIHAAILLLPQCEKAAYLTALQVAPSIVFTESDPLKFLRYTNYNPQLAGRALARYWRCRREIFGNRAFLPLIISEGSALDRDDIDFIQSGSTVFLPNDAHGRTVVFIDSSRQLGSSQEIRLRAAFFYGHVISHNDVSQQDAYVELSILSDPGKYDPEKEECQELIHQIFPIRAKICHFINCVPGWPSAVSPESIPRLIERQQTSYHQLYLHSNSQKQKILQSLAPHGLSREGIPCCIGGTWSGNHFIDQRLGRACQATSHCPQSFSCGNSSNLLHPAAASHLFEQHVENLKSNTVSSNRTAKNWRHELDQAIDLLPKPETEKYKEAVKVAPPNVWNEESNLDRFLQAENWNPSLAAKRVARYWQLRSSVFGAKRFQSLNQTGEDALRRNDLSVLQSGFVILLPNDAFQSSVICIDTSKLEEGTAKEIRDRCLFYMFSLLAENETSQHEGAVLLLKVDVSSLDCFDVKFLASLASALPLKFKAVHLISQETVPAGLERHLTFADETYAHTGTREEILLKLQAFGMGKSGLPKSAAGEWGYEKFFQWLEIRTRMEWKLPLGLSWNHTDENFPTIKSAYTQLPEDETLERKRRLNVIHCRRKRNRLMLDTMALQEHADELRKQNQKLVHENHRLQQLAAAAEIELSAEDVAALPIVRQQVPNTN